MSKEFVRYKRNSKKVKVNNKGGIKMATQIAATPILYGKEAEKVLNESKTQRSSKAKENEIALLKLFKLIK